MTDMAAQSDAPLDEEFGEPPAGEPAPARPFVITFTAPPAAPWDQHRLVRLEAQHASPLPEEQVLMDLRRLDSWRPSVPSRFAAAYFHRRDVSGAVSHSHLIDGREVTFSVGETGASKRRVHSTIPFVAAVVVAAGLVTGCLILSGVDADRKDQALEDQRAALRNARNAGEETERRIAEHRALTANGRSNQQMSSVLEDLVWLSRAKDPTVGVSAIEWRPDSLIVQTRSARSPIVTKDRLVEQLGSDRWQIERNSVGGDRGL